jgi:hypothetical protein
MVRHRIALKVKADFGKTTWDSCGAYGLTLSKFLRVLAHTAAVSPHGFLLISPLAMSPWRVASMGVNNAESISRLNFHAFERRNCSALAATLAVGFSALGLPSFAGYDTCWGDSAGAG